MVRRSGGVLGPPLRQGRQPDDPKDGCASSTGWPHGPGCDRAPQTAPPAAAHPYAVWTPPDFPAAQGMPTPARAQRHHRRSVRQGRDRMRNRRGRVVRRIRYPAPPSRANHHGWYRPYHPDLDYRCARHHLEYRGSGHRRLRQSAGRSQPRDPEATQGIPARTQRDSRRAPGCAARLAPAPRRCPHLRRWSNPHLRPHWQRAAALRPRRAESPQHQGAMPPGAAGLRVCTGMRDGVSRRRCCRAPGFHRLMLQHCTIGGRTVLYPARVRTRANRRRGDLTRLRSGRRAAGTTIAGSHGAGADRELG